MPDVERTQEFERIAGLPRRVLTLEDATRLAAEITPDLTLPGSKARALGVRPWQAVALVEAAENDGAWLALPVGQGKTLVGDELPRFLGTEGQSVIIMPASLREKTYADRSAYMADGWILSSPPPTIVSRESLQTPDGLVLLDRLRPRLIVIDESDELSNPDASATARIDRYVLACDARGEPCHVVTMTGTPSRSSIMGYWHLLCWTLGDKAPVPRSREEAELWAQAIDEKPPTSRGAGSGRRPKPGPLGVTVEAAREWYAKRLRETPGVVIVDEDSAGSVPLSFDVRYAAECSEIDTHYERFLVEGETPGGEPVTDPLSEWRLDGQLGCGVYYYYDPPPPEYWRDARRAEAKYVRNAILHSRMHDEKPLDTEGAVIKKHRNHPVIAGWLEVKDHYNPKKHARARWLSDSVVESVAEWLDEEPDSPGVVMCGNVEFAERLASLTGLAYYARQGRDRRTGRALHAADPNDHLIASWNACKRGFNLQAWSRMLIVHPPSSAKYLEQIVGRQHRAGQLEGVRITVLITSGGTLDAFEAAIREARFAKHTVSLTQKILRATIDRAPHPDYTDSNEYRWADRTVRAEMKDSRM